MPRFDVPFSVRITSDQSKAMQTVAKKHQAGVQEVARLCIDHGLDRADDVLKRIAKINRTPSK